MAKVLHSSKRKHAAIALSIVALLSMIPTFFASSNTPTVTNAASETSTGTASSTQNTPSPQGVLGDSVVAQLYNLQIIAANKGTVDTATQTYRYTVHLSIRNTSDEVLQISPGMQMHVADKNRSIYDVTSNYLPAGTIIGGPLGPEDTTILDIDYMLPADTKPETFIFQQDANTPATEVKL